MAITYLLQHLLKESSARSPESSAVSSLGRNLSYRELDTLSDQLATVLRANGAKNGDRIGIYMPLSLSSVTSVFGILKSGACYVPIDPNAPPRRVAYIIRDSGIKILVTDKEKIDELTSIFPEDCPLQTVVLIGCDDQNSDNSEARSFILPAGITTVNWHEVMSQPPVLSFNDNEPIETDLAYILYTSGSTGTPKGVMITHRSSMAFVVWAKEYVGLAPTDRVACHAPLHFDLSIFSMFSTIMSGATMIIVPEHTSTFPIRLAKFIEDQRITVWYSVPSVLILLVLYGNLRAHDLSKLQTIIFAGEVFPPKYLRKLIDLVPRSRYLNWYGPTETNVCTSYDVPLLVDPEQIRSIPIGKACTNTEVFALNSNGRKITVGEIGELFVRGPTIMLGYWGNHDKTARSLVQNPLSDHSDEFVYRTGDLVTLDRDGNYLFIGREDGMIKTRGYRVEVGEIEAVLYEHEGVKEVVVTAVPDEVFGKRLKAIVSLHDGTTLERDSLVAFCRKRLPHYMIPDMIEFRSVLPKTSTGKIDRFAVQSILE